MSDDIEGERVEVNVPSGIWWDLPDGRGSVYQDSGAMAIVTLTKDQMVLGGEPGTKWTWRWSAGYNPGPGAVVIGSFEAFMIDDESDDRPACLSCVDRPTHWLGRFRHRLWICRCGQAWRTRRGGYEKATWAWKRWPRP